MTNDEYLELVELFKNIPYINFIEKESFSNCHWFGFENELKVVISSPEFIKKYPKYKILEFYTKGKYRTSAIDIIEDDGVPAVVKDFLLFHLDLC